MEKRVFKTFIYPAKAELAPFTSYSNTLEMLETHLGRERFAESKKDQFKRKLDVVTTGGIRLTDEGTNKGTYYCE